MLAFLTKFLSRKFLTALGSLYIAYVSVTQGADSEASATTLVETITTSILALVPAVYLIMQGMVDKKEAEKK